MLKYISPRRLGTQCSLSVGNMRIIIAFQYADYKFRKTLKMKEIYIKN